MRTGMENVEYGKCSVCGKCGVWKMWCMENEEYGKCGVWKMRSK